MTGRRRLGIRAARNHFSPRMAKAGAERRLPKKITRHALPADDQRHARLDLLKISCQQIAAALEEKPAIR